MYVSIHCAGILVCIKTNTVTVLQARLQQQAVAPQAQMAELLYRPPPGQAQLVPSAVRQAWGSDMHDRHAAPHSHPGHAQLQRHHSHPPVTSPPTGSTQHVLSAASSHLPLQTIPAGHLDPVSRQVQGSSSSSMAMTIDLANLQGGPPSASAGVPQPVATHGHPNLDATQTGSLNMQLGGYHQAAPQTYNAMTGQAYITAAQTFPFTLTTTANTNLVTSDSVTQHSRTAADRGEESPMVGVCVQQSPVASH